MAVSGYVNTRQFILVGAVPLFAVSTMTVDNQYKLPELGTGRNQWLGQVGRTIGIEGTLLGPSRFAHKAALELLADLSMLFATRFNIPAVTGGVPVVSGLVTLPDMQITGLKFGQSSEAQGAISVSISLKHCPRGLVADLVAHGLSMAGGLAGTIVNATGVRVPLVGGAA